MLVYFSFILDISAPDISNNLSQTENSGPMELELTRFHCIWLPLLSEALGYMSCNDPYLSFYMCWKAPFSLALTIGKSSWSLSKLNHLTVVTDDAPLWIITGFSLLYRQGK